MKKFSVWRIINILFISIMIFGVVGFKTAPVSAAKGGTTCTTIQDGTLYRSNGDLITTGFAGDGYNYQAHLQIAEYSDYKLVMKWNDAWLSNKDCDGDGLLDRHLGFTTYKGSGAWVTNHFVGEYEGSDGQTCKWTYFLKIVAPPEDAYESGGYWYTADGVLIGPAIWGAFAFIQWEYNDPCGGPHDGYVSPAGPGLGGW